MGSRSAQQSHGEPAATLRGVHAHVPWHTVEMLGSSLPTLLTLHEISFGVQEIRN